MRTAAIFLAGTIVGGAVLAFVGWIYFAWTWMRDH